MSAPRHSWKSFLHYVLPSVSAMLLFSSYTIVDGIFVSKGVGDLALAGVNIALPFINFLSGVAILLSMGTSTLCAFALGEGKHDRAERIFSQTAAVIVVLSVLITIAVAIFAEPLAALLGAGPQTMGYSAQYLHVVCLFSLCFILSYCAEGFFGIADITGAYFAGLILCDLSDTRQYAAKPSGMMSTHR